MDELFRIELKERRMSRSDPPGDPPEDDPDDFDFYLWRYCHAQNRGIVVHVGSIELPTELDPDISKMLRDLPIRIRKLEAGRPKVIYFKEGVFEVKFIPEGDRMLCIIHWGGAPDEEASEAPCVSCDREQVIRELWQFVDGLARDGVDQGYLTEQQAHEFLGHRLPVKA